MNPQLLHYKLEQMKATGAGSFDVIFAAPDTLNE